MQCISDLSILKTFPMYLMPISFCRGELIQGIFDGWGEVEYGRCNEME